MLAQLQMAGENKRRSERVIPVVNDDEAVVIRFGQQHALGKMLDLSEGGTLVYLFLVDHEVAFEEQGACTLTLSHRNKVFDVPSKICRVAGRLLGFEFVEPGEEALHLLSEKLIRMEGEWMRISGKA